MVFGLMATPLLAAPFGWPAALVGFAAGGLAWAVQDPPPYFRGMDDEHHGR